MSSWLDGFERTVIDGKGGGSFVAGVPRRLVLHTTEGSTIAGAVAAYKAKGVPPHVTADPRRRERHQHVPVDRAAYALKNLAGGVETNRQGAVQVEIVGRASAISDLSHDDLAWLGTDVVHPLQQATGFALNHPVFVGPDAGTIATRTAKQRFTFDAWSAFDGICGHQHIPENDHWDPGPIDISTIVLFAQLQSHTTSEEEPMAPIPYFATAPGRGVYYVFGNTKTGLQTPGALALAQNLHRLAGWDATVHEFKTADEVSFFDSLATVQQ